MEKSPLKGVTYSVSFFDKLLVYIFLYLMSRIPKSIVLKFLGDINITCSETNDPNIPRHIKSHIFSYIYIAVTPTHDHSHSSGVILASVCCLVVLYHADCRGTGSNLCVQLHQLCAPSSRLKHPSVHRIMFLFHNVY